MSDYVNPSYDDANFAQKAARSLSILSNPAKKVSCNDGFWIAKHLSEVIREMDEELAVIKERINAGCFAGEAQINKAAMLWRHRMLLQQALNLLIKSSELKQ